MRIEPCQGSHTVQIFRAAQALTTGPDTLWGCKSLPTLLILCLRKWMLQEVIPAPLRRSIILKVHLWPLLKWEDMNCWELLYTAWLYFSLANNSPQNFCGITSGCPIGLKIMFNVLCSMTTSSVLKSLKWETSVNCLGCTVVKEKTKTLILFILMC